MLPFSPTQQWVIAITRHVTGNLSAVASSIIVYRVVLRLRKDKATEGCGNTERWVTPYHRLMLGLAIADILYSFWVGLSTLVVPAEGSDVVYRYGTTSTCSAQGFFMQFGVASHLYLAMLSTYFWLKIRYNVSDDVLWRRHEVWFHLLPWSVALGTGTLGLSLQLFNPMPSPLLGCWLGSYPTECYVPNGPPCTRGDRIKESMSFYAFVMAYAWLFLSFAIVVCTNIAIYRTIRHQERRNEKYLAARLQHEGTESLSMAFPPPPPPRMEREQSSASLSLPASAEMAPTNTSQVAEDNHHAPHEQRTRTAKDGKNECDVVAPCTDNSAPLTDTSIDKSTVSTVSRPSMPRRRSSQINRRHIKASRTAFVQSILYVSAAGFTAIWVFFPYVTFKFHASEHWSFAAVLLRSMFVPLQGVFNLLIYVRPEYLKLRRWSKNDWSRWRCLRHCLFSSNLLHPDTVAATGRRSSAALVGQRE